MAAWMLILAGALAGSNALGASFSSAFEVPGAESQAAFDLLYERFPEQSGFGADIVFRPSEGTVDAPEVARTVERLFDEVERIEHVAEVVSPYGSGGWFQVSADGRTAFARVRFDVPLFDVPASTIERVLAAAREVRSDDLQVEVGGYAVQVAEQTDPGRSEQIGFLAATLVLLVTFGSVVAAGLPIATALFGLGLGLLSIPLLAHVFPVPMFGPSLGAMIGIGVGIDYALFIVTRFRESLRSGASSEDACADSLATSGRAVLFAGVTVCIAMAGLFVMGIPMIRGMAVSVVAVIVTVMVASLTLLPALLGFAGGAIDRLPVSRLVGRARRDQAGTRWHRWSRFVQRHPLPASLAALAVLVLAAAPAFSMRLGMADAGSNPLGSATREAFDLMADGFGPGFNGPLLLAADVDDGEDVFALGRVARTLREDAGVELVGPPLVNEAGDAAVVFVVPATAPQDEATSDLIDRTREVTIPTAVAGHDVSIWVGGSTAVYNDVSEVLARRLPLFIAVVIGLSFLLLLVMFRSVLVAVKAAVMNLLSIGGGYGVIVAVFQWGWLADVFGVDRTGPIQSFVPMMLFAILFGISMDYEVFLISRIREDYLRTGDNAASVSEGLAATGRVITAAAAIMVTVFGSFVFSDDTLLKLFGLGLAVAIFLDAAIVRTVLVPSMMELLGSANWWLPRWLDRILPRLTLEPEASSAQVEGGEPPALVIQEAR